MNLKRFRISPSGRARHGLAALFAAAVAASGLPAPAAPDRTLRVGAFVFLQPTPQPACAAPSPLLIGAAAAFTAEECTFVRFTVDGGGATTDEGEAPELDPLPSLEVRFIDETGTRVHVEPVVHAGGSTYQFAIDPAAWEAGWAPGTIEFEIASTNASDRLTGQPRFRFSLNQLGTRTILDRPSYAVAPNGLPAEDLVVRGVTWKRDQKASFVASDPTDPAPNPDLVPAEVTVELFRADGGTVRKTATAGSDGLFSVRFSAAEIGEVVAGAEADFQTPIRIRSTARYTDAVSGEWATGSSDTEREAVALFESTPDRAQIRARFVSERGWVAPGERYVHEIEYRNVSGADATGVTIVERLPADATFVSASPAPDSVTGGTLTWRIGRVAAGLDWPSGTRAVNRILVIARARTTDENPRIVHQDLSATATLTQDGKEPMSSTTHGPRVSTQETARYGDRPFPVVLVDYLDAKHSPAAAGWTFDNRISNPHNPASLFTHYQNMSFGQLYPQGELAALRATDAGFSGGPFRWSNPYLRGNTCTGVSTVPPDLGRGPWTEFTPVGERIVDGWYQLPGQRQYYGQDGKGSALPGALIGVPQLQDIDSGCGPTGKLAFDAASIADPDIDYNEFDSDRNCVVDFFEVVFQGRGGNGDSQAHGYDNVWPHSSNLTDQYIDPETGLSGYVSNDQCRDRLERPLWFTDESRQTTTTRDMGDALKAWSRVGPYNVNPENGTTSVFAHEYGHSLGLPDFYSGDKTTIEYWDLMAVDGFQYMSVFSRQDLGWIVPRRTTPRETASLRESKVDTHRIDAIDARGRPYTLTGPNVHNADALYIELPHRTLIEDVPSGTHAWYSTAGNSFGCPGRTLDINLANARFAPEGTALTLSFKSWYEIEWDFDYGFVLVSTDGGKTFRSVPSEAGRSTPREFNPFANACQEQFSNGITGTSSADTFPANIPQRTLGEYPEPAFIDDSFDISMCAGVGCVVRLAYATDVGLAKRGWVIDDLKVTGSDGKTYFSDDVEQPRIGYGQGGWIRFAAGPAPFDHGYYIELRDRVSNDFDSAGQGERHPITWMPGVSIWYTDEAHGYGNNGVTGQPAQTVMDPRAQPEEVDPVLDDASFFPLSGLSTFQDASWIDNYLDEEDDAWEFRYACARVDVRSISGLGAPGASASIAVSASPRNCVRVMGAPVGLPKPPPLLAPRPRPPLPATGAPWPVWWGLAVLAGALALRRWDAIGTR